jgi:hypothetical protein
MTEGVEEGSPQEKEPGRERDQVSELTLTTNYPGINLSDPTRSGVPHNTCSLPLPYLDSY